MILKVSQKINNCGWCKQITINFNNKTIKTGAFQFHNADIKDLTATQYKQIIEYFKNEGFTQTEV